MGIFYWFFSTPRIFEDFWGHCQKMGAWVSCFMWFQWNRTSSIFTSAWVVSRWTNMDAGKHRKTLILSSMIYQLKTSISFADFIASLDWWHRRVQRDTTLSMELLYHAASTVPAGLRHLWLWSQVYTLRGWVFLGIELGPHRDLGNRTRKGGCLIRLEVVSDGFTWRFPKSWGYPKSSKSLNHIKPF